MSLQLELDFADRPGRAARLKPHLATAWRYGLTTFGPVTTSGAHFLASLLFVRNLPAAAFGLFSFVLVIVPFAMSMMGALLVIPVTRSLSEPQPVRARIVASCLKLNLLLSVFAALAVFAALMMAQAAPAAAGLLGLFGGTLTYRWFARCFAYVEGRVGIAVSSDLVYSLVLIAGLAVLLWTGHVTLTWGAFVLLLAALASLLPLGRKFFADQRAALSSGDLRLYGAIFRDVTRWSLLGVILTEMTVNAHAYLVTFISGPGPFALLALGMLLMRPISLVQSALPDVERPVMTRHIAARDWRALERTSREFGAALFAMWIFGLGLDGVLLIWFPSYVLKEGYGLQHVMIVGAISAVIMALRCLRGPPAVMLQAAGAFRELAGIGTKTSVISLGATLILLLAFGPIPSLGGILIGEVAILFYLRRLVAAWKARRG